MQSCIFEADYVIGNQGQEHQILTLLPKSNTSWPVQFEVSRSTFVDGSRLLSIYPDLCRNIFKGAWDFNSFSATGLAPMAFEQHTFRLIIFQSFGARLLLLTFPVLSFPSLITSRINTQPIHYAQNQRIAIPVQGFKIIILGFRQPKPLITVLIGL